MATTAYKVCPRCQTRAAVDAPVCAACGRLFKTTFAAPEVTRFVAAPVASRPASGRFFAVGGVVLLAVALLVGIFYRLQRAKTGTMPVAAPTVEAVTLPQVPGQPVAPVYARPSQDTARDADELRRRHTRLE